MRLTPVFVENESCLRVLGDLDDPTLKAAIVFTPVSMRHPKVVQLSTIEQHPSLAGSCPEMCATGPADAVVVYALDEHRTCIGERLSHASLAAQGDAVLRSPLLRGAARVLAFGNFSEVRDRVLTIAAPRGGLGLVVAGSARSSGGSWHADLDRISTSLRYGGADVVVLWPAVLGWLRRRIEAKKLPVLGGAERVMKVLTAKYLGELTRGSPRAAREAPPTLFVWSWLGTLFSPMLGGIARSLRSGIIDERTRVIVSEAVPPSSAGVFTGHLESPWWT